MLYYMRTAPLLEGITYESHRSKLSQPVTREFIELISKNLFIKMTISHILADFSPGDSGMTLRLLKIYYPMFAAGDREETQVYRAGPNSHMNPE